MELENNNHNAELESFRQYHYIVSYNHERVSTCDFGSYRIVEHRRPRLRLACSKAQIYKNYRYSHAKSMDLDEDFR